MSSEGLTSKKLDDNELDQDTPLSDEEISRLIKESRETSFKRKEIKKEMNESFKKVSLHDIAKKYSKDLSVKQEQSEKDEQEKQENINTDTAEPDINKENKEIVKNEDDLETQDNIAEEPKIQQEQESKIKSLNEDEHLLILEEAKKEAFENGKQEAYSEIKEGADAAVAKLNSISEKISKTDQLDLSELENIISNKILDLSSELTGKIIKALPTEFLKKIKGFISSLENNNGKIDIFISENDYKELEKNKDIKPKLKEMNITKNPKLNNGEVILEINGIKIKQIVQSKIK